MVKRGVLTVTFWATKNTPRFLDLFFGRFRFGQVRLLLLT